MNRSDWLLSIAFILVGLACFAMSTIYVSHPNALYVYISKAINLCIWIGVPLMIVGLVYLFIKKKSNK